MLKKELDNFFLRKMSSVCQQTKKTKKNYVYKFIENAEWNFAAVMAGH
jgi:hypothetical protein